MRSLDPGDAVVKTAAGVLTRPGVMSFALRLFLLLRYRLCNRYAFRKFRSLQTRVMGLLEQVEEEHVKDGARTELVSELELLRVYPPALDGKRGETKLEEELEYLHGCMETPDDRLSLPLARRKFPKGLMQALNHRRDVITMLIDDADDSKE